MRTRINLIALLFAAMIASIPANAARRAVRVASDGWGAIADFGPPECPGTYPLSGNAAATLPLDWGSYRFHGIGDTAYTYQTYCQPTALDEFSQASFEFAFPPEPGLRTLVGANTDNAATGLRYTWLTGDSVFDGPGFQWTLYWFPRGVTIVALYGLVDPNTDLPLVLDASTAIKQGTTTVWSAEGNSFDGEYFCFLDGEFAGLWNGELDDTGSACLEAAVLFNSSFE